MKQRRERGKRRIQKNMRERNEELRRENYSLKTTRILRTQTHNTYINWRCFAGVQVPGTRLLHFDFLEVTQNFIYNFFLFILFDWFEI
jgi:hypothetical protein